MDPKVFVYQSGLVFKVEPPLITVPGGRDFTLVNATTQDLIARLPKGSADADADREFVIPAGRRARITAISQGENTTRAYPYRVKVASRKAKGNSDPILIIEN